MKKIYFIAIAGLFFGFGASAQIVNIPDANFKAKLLTASPSNNIAEGNTYGVFITIDANGNGEIEESEALVVRKLRIGNAGIADLTGINKFYHISRLFCSNNLLTSIDFSGMPFLNILVCNDNNLQNVDLSNTNIESLNFDNNPGLLSLNVKNQYDEIHQPAPPPGLSDPDMEGIGISFSGTPNLSSICADEYEVEKYENLVALYGYTCAVSSYCTMVPGGTYYTVHGIQQYDADNNGCDSADNPAQQVRYQLTNTYYDDMNVFANSATGNYNLYLGSGNTTITPIMETNYFTVSPPSLTLSFPSAQNPYEQNFCIAPADIHPDLEVVIVPASAALPGVNVSYNIIYKNKGTMAQSGYVNLHFDDAVADFVASNPTFSGQSQDNLFWDFTDLKPFESRQVAVTLHFNSPTDTPALIGGELLYFIATITSPETDETQDDNISTLYQTVVNSFDPNDKTCIEGENLPPELAGTYVHYVIRFENTGTANAQNVVVKDIIDKTKFNVASLVPLGGSHPFTTRITDTNKVEFVFENIQLPFDDANNDGFVAFKIKTLPTLVAGNSFSNTASIYFDYNAPIVTNTATTTLQVLGTDDFEFENYFTLYPNPAKDILNIKAKQNIQVSSISIYNTLGQLVLGVPNPTETIDVSMLTTGNYFIKIHTDKGIANTRFLKK